MILIIHWSLSMSWCMNWSMVILNKSLLRPESSVKKQLDPREQLRSARTVSHSCDAFVEWFVVGSVRRYYALTIARRSGRISGADLDPVPCQGHPAACLQSSVMNAMLWWGLRSQCFIWNLASNFEQELVPQPLLSYLPPTPTVVLLRLDSEFLSLTLGFWFQVALHFW